MSRHHVRWRGGPAHPIDVVGALPVLTLSGSVDLATLPRLQDGLLAAWPPTTPAQRVAVDLDGVDVLDDTALGVLLGAAGRARQAGGDLIVVCAAERHAPAVRRHRPRPGRRRRRRPGRAAGVLIGTPAARPATTWSGQAGPENWPPSSAAVPLPTAGALSSA